MKINTTWIKLLMFYKYLFISFAMNVKYAEVLDMYPFDAQSVNSEAESQLGQENKKLYFINF